MKKILQFFKKLSDQVNKAVTNGTAGLIVIITLMMLYGVFFRYVLDQPIPWILPISKILLTWIGLLGVTIAFKDLEHVAMKGIVYLLPEKIQVIFFVISYCFIALFLLVVLLQSIPIVLSANELIMISAKIYIQKKWAMLAVPVFAFVNLIHLLGLNSLLKLEIIERDRILAMKS